MEIKAKGRGVVHFIVSSERSQCIQVSFNKLHIFGYECSQFFHISVYVERDGLTFHLVCIFLC